MRPATWNRGLLLLPLTTLLCADSLAPGCGGRSSEPTHGTFTCSVTVDGSVVPCTGEWWHWDGSGNTEVHASGSSGAVVARATLRYGGSTPTGVELRNGDGGLSAVVSATTTAGGYAAGQGLAGSEARLTLSRLVPPSGALSGVLVPSTVMGSTAPPGPNGTTVTVEFSF